jgi:2-keto-4-pentenoate hydratase/2-oxohepta-3-ene-1,7-dioic acid hydratase in catechol pathway
MTVLKPSKIIAIGLNYYDHARELKMPVPDHPIMFIKPASAVIMNGGSIIYPRQSKNVHYEGELAMVIGKKAKNVKKSDANKYIKGFTCANDVTARDLQNIDGQWTRAKSFDTFCPLGPRIIKNIDPMNLNIRTRINGKTKQNSNTKNMIFNVYELVSFVSSVMTLLPGDVILAGTPPGVGPLKIGDIVEVEIEKIGILKNMVISAKP